jgi:glycosyltransferase involved in cell wall biosynthesis
VPAIDSAAAPRCLLLLDSIARGGAERSMMTLAVELACRGRLQAFVTLNSRGELYQLPEELRPYHLCLQGRSLPSACLAVRRQILAATPVTVFAALPRASLVAVCAAAGTGQRVLTSQRFVLNRFLGGSPLDWLRKLSVLATHVAADGVVCISRDVKEDLDRSCPALARKSRVLYNAIALPDVEPDSGASRLLAAGSLAEACSAASLRLVTVGRLVPEKRFAELIAAVLELSVGVPLTLDVFGDGPERAALAERVRLAGAADRVRLRGFVADVERHLGEYDAFLFNSNSEGFGRALYEAYLAAVPVLYPARLRAGAELLAGLPGAAQFAACDAPSLRAGLERIARAPRDAFAAAVTELRRMLSPAAHVAQFLQIAAGVDGGR